MGGGRKKALVKFRQSKDMRGSATEYVDNLLPWFQADAIYGHLPFFSVIKGGYGLSFANRGRTSSAFCATAHALCIETFRCDCIEAGLVIDANLPLSNRPVMMSISNSLIDRGSAVCAKLGHLTDDEETGNPRTGASPPGIVSGLTHSPDLF